MMNKFIVVEVILDCDHVEGLELKASFKSKEEAENYIQQEKDKNQASWEVRKKYVSDYVDNITYPEDNTVAFYLKNKYNYNHYSCSCSQSELLEGFKNQLLAYSYTLRRPKDFNPPPVYFFANNLFVLEVKDE